MIQMIQVFFLGLIQGITELLPISSSLHVLLAARLMDFTAIDEKSFASIIQMGSGVALLIRLLPDIRSLIQGALKRDQIALSTCLSYGLVLLPSLIVGLLWSSFIKTELYTTQIMAISLMVGGALFLLLDPISIALRRTTISYRDAIVIGLFQLLSFIPGASRLGTNLIGGTLSGLSRKTLLPFSFMLAIPILLGGGLHDLVHIRETLTTTSLSLLSISFLSSFTATFFLFPLILRFLQKRGLFITGWYRIALGALFLLLE